MHKTCVHGCVEFVFVNPCPYNKQHVHLLIYVWLNVTTVG